MLMCLLGPKSSKSLVAKVGTVWKHPFGPTQEGSEAEGTSNRQRAMSGKIFAATAFSRKELELRYHCRKGGHTCYANSENLRLGTIVGMRSRQYA